MEIEEEIQVKSYRTENEIKSMITLLHVELNRLSGDSWAQDREKKMSKIKTSLELLQNRLNTIDINRWLDGEIIDVKALYG